MTVLFSPLLSVVKTKCFPSVFKYEGPIIQVKLTQNISCVIRSSNLKTDSIYATEWFLKCFCVWRIPGFVVWLVSRRWQLWSIRVDIDRRLRNIQSKIWPCVNLSTTGNESDPPGQKPPTNRCRLGTALQTDIHFIIYKTAARTRSKILKGTAMVMKII